MAEKVSEQNEIALPIQPDDGMYIFRGGVSYKIDPTKLFQGFLKFVAGYEGYVVIPANGNTDMTRVQENDILIGKGAYYPDEDGVMMRALQDDPNDDSHFAISLKGREF